MCVMPTAELRDTGIGVVGNKPWGTHFCYFCESKDDQLDILVPYFKAGLQNKEFCVWVLSEPLTVQAARNALDDAIPGLNRYIAGHSIEMLEARDWYLINNVFDPNRVRNTWNEKLEQALARGYS